MMRHSIAGALMAAVLSTAAYAGVDISFGIEIAPPPPRVEVLPAPRPGHIWTPGYWAWDHGRHVWIEGRWIEVRRGQLWVPERWVEYRDPRGAHWHFEPGHWEREHQHHYERGSERERR